MTNDPIETARQWVLKAAHELWMEDSDKPLTLERKNHKAEDPPLADLIREAKQLAYFEWIEILRSRKHHLRLRLLPMGREIWERHLKASQYLTHGVGSLPEPSLVSKGKRREP